MGDITATLLAQLRREHPDLDVPRMALECESAFDPARALIARCNKAGSPHDGKAVAQGAGKAENPDDRGYLPGDALTASPGATWEDVEAPRCAALRTIDAALDEPAVTGNRMRELIASAPWADDYARYRDTGRMPSSFAPKPALYPPGVEGHDDGCACEDCIAVRAGHYAARRAIAAEPVADNSEPTGAGA